MLRAALHSPSTPQVLLRTALAGGAVGGLLGVGELGPAACACGMVVGGAAGWAVWLLTAVVSFGELLLATWLDRDGRPRTRPRVAVQAFAWYAGIATFALAPVAAFGVGQHVARCFWRLAARH